MGSARIKAECRTLMKLTLGLYFITTLRTAFTHVDPECVKIQSIQQCYLALLGPMSVKFALKVTPGVLRTAFELVDPKTVKNAFKSSVSFYALGSTSLKAVHRTLMKLSPGQVKKMDTSIKVHLLFHS